MSGKNFLKINDLVTFSLLDQNLVKVKDDYENISKGKVSNLTTSFTLGQEQQMINGLMVRIAATHSGIVTRNNGFYLPDKMKKGASSFTDNYPKPMLLHHEEHKDPVGRVVQATYCDTSGIVHDKFNLKNGLIVKDRHGSEKGRITDSMIRDFVDGKMPFGMQVDLICTLLKDSLLEDSSYDGLGHIQIVGHVTDKSTIEKLLDGRYLTGSVGATTDRAVCSVCKQDWTDTGSCEHRPGGIYDGTKCFIIAGSLVYNEYSFVNVPADRHSKVLELSYNGIRDSIEIANDYKGRIYEVRLGFPQYDSVTKEEERMAKDKQVDVNVAEPVVIKDDVKPAPAPESVKTEEKPAEPVVVTDNVQPEVVVALEVPVVVTEPVTTPVVTEPVVEDACKGGKKKKKMKDEEFDTFFTKILSTKDITIEDTDLLYELMCEEIEDAVESKEIDVKAEDAVLSSEQRSKLAKSTFCGPGRSFPVPDCAHVTAARRLIGRYKGEGDKSKILACVSRKAKALGCDSKKEEAQKGEEVVVPKIDEKKVEDNLNHSKMLRIVLAALEEDKYYSNDQPVLAPEDAQALQSILKKMASLVGKDSMIGCLATEDLSMTLECEKALLDEVAKAEDIVGTLRDEIATLRKEYNHLFQDMEAMQDGLTSSKAEVRKVKEEYVNTLTILKDGKVDKDSLSKLTDELLTAEHVRLTTEVDMVKIVDKLGNGMSREPTGTVEDPTVIRDDKQDSQKRQMSVQDLSKIQEDVYKILFSRGQTAADAYIKRLQLEGRLPMTEK